jgi:hypothetical protein
MTENNVWKLLHVLQQKSCFRLGASLGVDVDKEGISAGPTSSKPGHYQAF